MKNIDGINEPEMSDFESAILNADPSKLNQKILQALEGTPMDHRKNTFDMEMFKENVSSQGKVDSDLKIPSEARVKEQIENFLQNQDYGMGHDRGASI